MGRFKVLEQSLERVDRRGFFLDCSAGGFVAFEGWVRNNNEGGVVTSLEYEAYPELAEKEGERILVEAKAYFDVLQVSCYHRIGHLQLGEMAVWVGVSAAHRDAAFSACRFIIDEVKQRVPIWKKEHYENRAAQWVRCGSGIRVKGSE
jgi:molybdopterin synthase catalytic subunit